MTFINRYYEKLRNLSFEEKEAVAKEVFNELLTLLPHKSEEDIKESKWLIFGLAISVVFSDNILDNSEIKLINYILNEQYDKNSILNIIKEYDKHIDFIINIFKFSKKNFKKKIIQFCLLFALADGEYADEERRVIENLAKL